MQKESGQLGFWYKAVDRVHALDTGEVTAGGIRGVGGFQSEEA